jgi:hypothetical protein
VPLEPAFWNTPVNPELAHWGDGELKLELTRRAGSRMHTPDGYSFGMYSLKIKADSTPGAVTAFYVSVTRQAGLWLHCLMWARVV